jgi:hypothetical protein
LIGGIVPSCAVTYFEIYHGPDRFASWWSMPTGLEPTITSAQAYPVAKHKGRAPATM